jgi:hypothetical protein
MPYTFNGNVLYPHQSFVIGETQYSGNVLELWNIEDLTSIGLEWIEQISVEPQRRLIPKSRIQERVNDIGKLDDILTILNSQSIMFARWFAPDWPNVYFDDEGMLQLLHIVGCTSEQIAEITA